MSKYINEENIMTALFWIIVLAMAIVAVTS